MLVDDNLSNLTLASADDRLCYWTFGLLDFYDCTAVIDILDFWIVRLFYNCIDAFFNLF